MEFRILGPLAVEWDGRQEPVTSAKLRTVLARLLLGAGRLVTVDGLIAEVWDDSPPPSAVNTLQTYISQLRHMLEPQRRPGARSRVLRTVPGGYLLTVEEHALDRERFEDALRAGRAAFEAAGWEAAADRLREGLTLWRGPALVNVAGRTVASEAARLNELRLAALEMRVDSDLARGRHDELVGELERLVREHPWRERFAGQLMLALYRCRRQAEALACYRDTHARLVAELGISPSPPLCVLEQRILRQSPDLEWRGPAEALRAVQPPRTGSSGDVVLPPDAVPPGEAIPVVAGAEGRPPVAPRLVAARRVGLVGGVVAALLLASLGAGTWRHPSGNGRVQSAAGADVFHEFDLAVHPGIGYDLDIPAGKPADWHATNDPRSPDYQFLDFYRTSAQAPESQNQISGVSLRGDDHFNAVHLVADGDPPSMCRRLPTAGGGNVHLRDLHVGAKVCVHTNDDRWAMITIERLPAERAALLFIHVAVLNR